MVSNEIRVTVHTMDKEQWQKHIAEQAELKRRAMENAHKNYIRWKTEYENYCQKHNITQEIAL